MKYNYQARNKQGEIYSGLIEASSKEAAVSLLRERGLYPTFLEETDIPIYARKIGLFERITKKDLVIFSRQLAIMFKSNISLVESLIALGQENKNSDFKEKIFKISEAVEGGTAFSKALSYYPKIFSVFYITVIKSGEASGKLSESLDYLAEHLEKEYHLTTKVRGALIYPALVIFVVLLVLALLVFFVLPNLIEIFEQGQYELPLATRIVIFVANWFRTWWWLVAIALITSIVFFSRHYSTKKGRKFFDEMFLKIPIIKNFLQMVYISRFAENFSTLTSSGLPIIQSLEISGDIIGNYAYKEKILMAKEEAGKGEMVSSVLRKFPNLFPAIFVQMFLVGEKTGRLSSSLMSVVDFYEKEIDRAIGNILSILEPILIIILGAVVGGVMLSVLMPLYQIMSF